MHQLAQVAAGRSGGQCHTNTAESSERKKELSATKTNYHGDYCLSGTGQLIAENIRLGYFSHSLPYVNSFFHSGGTNTVNELSIEGGTYELSAGGLISHIESVGQLDFIGSDRGCHGRFEQRGGINDCDTLILKGSVLGDLYSEHGTAFYDLFDGELYADDIYIGQDAADYAQFSQSGGINTITNNLYIAYEGVNSHGEYSLNEAGRLEANAEYVGNEGTGIFNQSGGVNILKTALYIALEEDSSGTYNLSGGILSVPYISYGAGTAVFNNTGGTLFISQSVNAGNTVVFDTGGYDVDFYGIISGPGGFTKAGDGKLRLMAPSTYSGTTTITGGTLEIAAGIDPYGTSLIDIQSGKAVLSTMDINKSNLNVNTAEDTVFEVASGTHVIGTVSGSGITMVLDGASLAATSITQGSLIIGGTGSAVALKPVPEPSCFVILGIGLLTFAIRILKKTTKNR